MSGNEMTELLGHVSGYSAIGVLAVADLCDAHDADLVRDFINDPIVSNPDSPVVLGADEFAATGWSGIFSEWSDRSGQFRTHLGGYPLQILFR